MEVRGAYPHRRGFCCSLFSSSQAQTSATSPRETLKMLPSLRQSRNLPLRRFIHKCRSASSNNAPPDPSQLSLYRESFAKRMAMAGVKPHHAIALGVSGGPDSTALCVLTAGWKFDGLGAGPARSDGSGYIDGLLGIVVDHRLRPESSEEAELVRGRVSKMGIKCVVETCDWSGGKPKLGHLQEAARDMRYRIFQSVCIEQQIGVLLIAHHADDQAELFVLRSSRNSGVLGLAGMAFISQLFLTHGHYCAERNSGIILVRPMLEFSKDDMYKICELGYQEWVEDPTNQRPLFARNRLRISLKSMSSNAFRSELQRLIAVCRLTRSFVQNVCHEMIKHCVTISDLSYAIIDLEKLDPSNVEDLCLSKFLAIILQFISQRHRPIRGSVSQLLMDYLRMRPCKTSLTAAGCYLSAAPRSKGTKIVVCFHDSPQSLTMPLSHIRPCNEQPLLPGEIDPIISDLESYSDQSVAKPSSVHFLHAKSSADVLNEARELHLISEPTFSILRMMQMEEQKSFNTKPEGEPSSESMHAKKVATSCIVLHAGESCYFMSRFIVTWSVCRDELRDGFSPSWNNLYQSGHKQNHLCPFCMNGQVISITIRHMVDADWLYLAKISNNHSLQGFQDHADASIWKLEQEGTNVLQCSAHMQLSAKRALHALKSIPVSARRALPVVVNSHDLLLCIPSICFSCCSYLSVSAVFKPRVPLGGGHCSYI